MDTPPTIPEPDDPWWGLTGPPVPTKKVNPPTLGAKIAGAIFIALILVAFVLPVGVWLTRALWELAL